MVLLQYFFHSELEKVEECSQDPCLTRLINRVRDVRTQRWFFHRSFGSIPCLVGRTLLVRSIEEKTVVSALGRENCVLRRQ